MKKFIFLIFLIIILAIGFSFLQKEEVVNIPKDEVCIQVITFAKDPETSECVAFPNPCIVPESWKSCDVKTFDDCVKAGNPVTESYPRQCRDANSNQSFTENIGSELEKIDLIRLDNPRPNQEVITPLSIEGEARGTWFFEGDSPVVLTDWDGKIIAEGFITATGEWMTEEFVKFEGTLEFEKPEDIGDFSKKGYLILRKDNPSGLPEQDDALEIPVLF